MTYWTISARAALCLAIAGYATQAFAGDTITEANSTLAGGRAMEVMVGQAEIKANIAPARVPLGGFGLFGALAGAVIESSINSGKSKKAESVVTPIRDSLGGFDTDGLALATTRNAIGKFTWLRTDDITFSKDSSPAGQSKFLDSVKTNEAAFVSYSYELAPDFSSLHVTAVIFFAEKVPHSADIKPEDRVRGRNLAYLGIAHSIVMLPGATGKADENAAHWAYDNGKPIKAAMTQAFGRMEVLIPRLLTLTDTDIKTYRKNKRGGMAGYSGRTIESDADHSLFWTDGFLNVEPLDPTAGTKPEAAIIPAVAQPAQPPAEVPAPATPPLPSPAP